MLNRGIGILLTFFLIGCGSKVDNPAGINWPKGESWPAEPNTFFIRNGRIFDKTGQWFVPRGVNNTHNYYPEQAYSALPRIKELGFNTVRIVWCADTLVRAGRCDPKDIHSLSELEKILARLRSLELVGILNLQNATGSNDPSDLVHLVDWYTRPDVAELLTRYQDILLLNVANEWHGSFDDPTNIYRSTYVEQIPRFRKAGLNHVLLIDARGWAQQFSSISENYETFQSVDPNILMSVHMFDHFGDEAKVRTDINAARDQQIPLIIGEFSCVHYPGQDIACETLMETASQWDRPIGYLAWSFSGNSNPLEPLDVASYQDWTTLSPMGQKIIYHPQGIKSTSQTACLFQNSKCY